MTRRKHKTSKAYRNTARKLLKRIYTHSDWGIAFEQALVDISVSSRWEK